MIRPQDRIRGPVDEPKAHRPTQHERLAAVAADVAHGRDPGGKHHAGHLGQDEVAELTRARQLTGQWRGRPPEAGAAQHVAVDVGVSMRPPNECLIFASRNFPSETQN